MTADYVTIRLPKGVWRYNESKMLGPKGGFGAGFAVEVSGVPGINSAIDPWRGRSGLV